MADEALISIVLPTYNGADYLAEALESILAQTHTHWELLIVDDCSTDATAQIAAQYAARDARIRLLRHAVNKKLPAALNTGFDAAQGAYLTWTSDDNLYQPHALARMLQVLQAQPEVDLVYADMLTITADGQPLGRATAEPPELLVRKSVIGACFLYTRHLQERTGRYDESLFLVEDYDFWLRASMHGRFLPLHEDLYSYRVHGSSLTATKKPRILALREAMLRKHLPNLPWATPRLLAEGYSHVAALAGVRRAWWPALRAWGQALRYAPGLASRRLLAALIGERWRQRLLRWLNRTTT